MSHPAPGRHRAPARHSATLALASALGRTTQPAAKASAVVAVSAGMVAAFSLPASAGPQHAAAAAAVPTVGSDVSDLSAISAAPSVALSAAAPVSSGLVAPTFGDIGFTGVVRPKPKPKAVVHVVVKPVLVKPVVVKHAVVKHVVVNHAVAKPVVVEHAVVKPVVVKHAVVKQAVVKHVAAHRAVGRHAARPVARHVSRPVQHSSRSTVRHTIHHSAPPAPSPTTGTSHSGILAIAARYAGVPYLYGGSSPSGFDCSGFTSYVFRQAGISLPRTASSQQASVHHVSSPAPGDLVFFGYPAYHVGIYAGGGKMWDSPHTGSSVGLHTIYGGVSGYGRP